MKIKLAIFLLAINVSAVFSQDPHFTQFHANPLYLAPSFAGGTMGQRFVANYRNQWLFFPGTYNTFSISFDQNISNYRSGVGLLLLGDYAGDGNLGTTMAGAAYSYTITPMRNFSIRPGLSFYYLQQSVNFSRLIFGSQLYNDNPYSPQIFSTVSRDIDVSTSILAHTDNIWFGVTWDHLLKPERSFLAQEANIPYKFSIYGGYKYKRLTDLKRPKERSLSLAFNYVLQGKYQHLDLGIYIFRQPMFFGVWYRGTPIPLKGDAVALMFGYKHKEVGFAYSYDFTISRLGLDTGGSHEISIQYEMNLKPKKKYRAIPCPTF